MEYLHISVSSINKIGDVKMNRYDLAKEIVDAIAKTPVVLPSFDEEETQENNQE